MRSRRRCGSLPTRPTSKTAGEAESALPICCLWTQSWGGGEFRLALQSLSIVRSVIWVGIHSPCEILSFSCPNHSVSTIRNHNSWVICLQADLLVGVWAQFLTTSFPSFSVPAGWTLGQRGEGGGPPAAGNGYMHKRKCIVVSEGHNQVIEGYKCDFSGDQIWEKCLCSTGKYQRTYERT